MGFFHRYFQSAFKSEATQMQADSCNFLFVERLFYVSQVFNTCLIGVYNVLMEANTPDQKAE